VRLSEVGNALRVLFTLRAGGPARLYEADVLASAVLYKTGRGVLADIVWSLIDLTHSSVTRP